MKRAVIRLGEIAATSSGGTPQRGIDSFFGGNIPWVKSGELPDGYVESVEEHLTEKGLSCSAAKILPEGTLLIALYGATIGKLGLLRFPAATNQAICSIIPNDDFDNQFLFYWLMFVRRDIINSSFGGAQPNISQSTIKDILIPILPLQEQMEVVKFLTATLSTIEQAKSGLTSQLAQLKTLENRLVADSIRTSRTCKMGDVLSEITFGVGKDWRTHSVLGATRNGVAPAREQPGKHAERYKPVTAGTVFYNPMRILIGSIAFVDDDDQPGITSPDYVVLKGKSGVVDSRWFYYWLRSPWGERCIQSMARGAVRERMLFSRLAEGEIELPDYETQRRASRALAQIKPMRKSIQKQIEELELLPQKLLAQVFES